jgi:hypothetical protein
MKLREEIVYMSLENKYLYCIPVVYREMLQSLSAIKESISFNYNHFSGKAHFNAL